jgi:subtilisin family serine protease
MLVGVAARAQAGPPAGDFEPNQVVVELQPAVSVETIKADYRATRYERVSPSSNIYLFELPAGSNMKEILKRMEKDARLLSPEPNLVIQPPEDSRLPQGGARHRAWGIGDAEPSPYENAASALNLSIAHDISRGEGVTVAVLDTGAQLDHPALRDNFEGVKRYDFVGDDDDPSEPPIGTDEDGNPLEDELGGHGTHVAGIVDQVAPEAKIMPLRVLNTKGYGDAFTIAQAVSYAQRNGANVINLSLGTPSRQDGPQKNVLQRVIRDATKNGVLVAAAAGNSNSSEPYYPAAADRTMKGFVAVTSVSMYGRKSDFANYGKWVGVAAPGEGIRSAFPGSKYAYWSGTSMATPFVSGEAALLRAVYGSLDPADVEERILCSARPLTATDPTYAAMLGAGSADVGASLAPGACNTTL